ncbi:T9SS type A sorting domain-containing protein [Salibacteraceae bacterium]|nr:T9SS type A sorting domain-containing protein [Salibacteraceae bacterium]
MKHLLLIIALIPFAGFAQFDFYGPEPFGDILDNTFTQSWTPSALSSIENKKYVVILDQATQSNVVSIGATDIELIEYNPIANITGATATYGSVMQSIFQIVDENTHFENDVAGGSGTYTPLSSLYKVNPLLHSYYNLNSDASSAPNATDGGSIYITEPTNTGYLLIEFTGTAASTTIKAVEQWVYNATTETLEENTAWADRYLMINGSSLTWTTTSANASNFMLADATDLFDMEIASGSDFNPLNVTYQPNATADIPTDILPMENSKIIDGFPNQIASVLSVQLNNSTSATQAASDVLDIIETTLAGAGESLRYPKAFYLALRENMLSHTVSSSDVFNARLGNRTVEHIYFTNESDISGEPHPFMVMACHATSTRPNLLVDVNRPPGAEMGVGYAQSTVTRNGKLGEFLVKIPLKDYGLITTLLDNDLSSYGDLASDFDASHGTATTKDVYNYTGLASIGMAVDGVTIYPAQNNNLRFAVEDAEVTSSGIHVGGGLELHYHADGHAFNGNGINLYNIADYTGKDHPPVIGMSYDGIALFGKYETSFSSMAGYGIALDQYGGHDHGDAFGYHYHAHTQSITSSSAPNPTFDEHILLVGAWKGDINNIPGFLQVKDNQLMNTTIGPYAGSTSTLVLGIDEQNINNSISIYPNPAQSHVTIIVTEKSSLSVYNNLGKKISESVINSGSSYIQLNKYASGIYFFKITNKQGTVTKKVIVD